MCDLSIKQQMEHEDEPAVMWRAVIRTKMVLDMANDEGTLTI
jgi:hypothetical protein